MKPKRQTLKIIRKSDLEKQYEASLVVEQDYWLASLFDAMKMECTSGKQEALNNLKSVTRELEMYREKNRADEEDDTFFSQLF